MLTKNEQLIANTQKIVDAAVGLATASIVGIEKLTHIQLEASRQIVEDTSKSVKQLANLSDPKDVMACANKIAACAVKANLASVRDACGVVNELQGKIGRVADEELHSLQEAALSSVEMTCGKLNPNGGTLVVDALKNWFDSANKSLAAINKIARQVTELANGNLNVLVKGQKK